MEIYLCNYEYCIYINPLTSIQDRMLALYKVYSTLMNASERREKWHAREVIIFKYMFILCFQPISLE